MSTRATLSRLPGSTPALTPVTWADVTPGMASTARVYADNCAGLVAAGPVSRASIGSVELTGNWLSSVSDTCLMVEAAGSDLASVPPQEMRRNGAPRASSAMVITVTYTTGRRMTDWASRYHAPFAS